MTSQMHQCKLGTVSLELSAIRRIVVKTVFGQLSYLARQRIVASTNCRIRQTVFQRIFVDTILSSSSDKNVYSVEIVNAESVSSKLCLDARVYLSFCEQCRPRLDILTGFNHQCMCLLP